MPVPTQDPPRHLIDERPRFYRLKTPHGTHVVVGLGGADDAGSIQITRPLSLPLEKTLGTDRLRLPTSMEEIWAIWALLTDALNGAGQIPEWVNELTGPTGPDGDSLPPLPGAPPAEPF